MTVEESFASLGALLGRQIRASVALAARAENLTFDMRRANITEDLASEFVAIAKNAYDRFAERDLRAYDAGYKPDSHELTYLPLNDDHDRVRGIVDSFERVGNLPLLVEEDHYFRGLRFYALALGGRAGERAIFFRHTTARFELDRGGIGAIFAGGTYTKITDRAFLFDRDIDCIAWDGYLFIANVTQFERIFDYLEELRARADQAIDQLVASVPIANEEEFRRAVAGQIQMVAKAARVAGKPYLATLTMEAIKNHVRDFDLPLEIRRDPGSGREELVFEQDREKRWTILKLLDDDYLTSNLTTLRYEANSKSTV